VLFVLSVQKNLISLFEQIKSKLWFNVVRLAR
jgi:hypothetical protein